MKRRDFITLLGGATAWPLAARAQQPTPVIEGSTDPNAQVMPLGAERTASGDEVAWKVTGADQYSVWATDSSGSYTSNNGAGAPVVAGTSSALEMLEPSFHQDLNADGVIGLAVMSGGTVEVSSAYSGPATFMGSSGILQLDQSVSFSGTVAGMTGQDTLDLRDIIFATIQSPTYSGTSTGGTLSVSDGTHNAKIALLGNYLASTFVASSDGHGGTNVVDPLATPFHGGLDVTKYGVVGDGTTDDTQKLQSLINSSPNGTLFYFPAGTYLVSNTVHFWQNDFGIVGDLNPDGSPASILKSNTPNVTVADANYGTGDGSFQIRNMEFWASNQGGTGFYSQDAIASTIENSAFKGYIGLYNYFPFVVALRNDRFLGDGGKNGSHIGYLAHLSTESLIENSDFSGWDEGARVSGAGMSMIDSTFERNGIGLNAGIDKDGNAWLLRASTMTDLTFSDNDIGIKLASAAGVSLSNSQITGSTNAPSGQSSIGLYASYIDQSQVTGLQVSGSYSNSAVQIDSGATNDSFLANTVTNSNPTGKAWNIAANLPNVVFDSALLPGQVAITDSVAPEWFAYPGANIVDVTAHGVVGDNLTDNAAALQALVNSSPNGTIFYFPKGVYRLYSTVDFSRLTNFAIIGDGKSVDGSVGGTSIIGYFSPGPLIKANYASTGGTFHIRDVNLQSYDTAFASQNAVSSSIENVNIVGNIGIRLDNPVQVSLRSVNFDPNVDIRSVSLVGNNNLALVINGGHDNWLEQINAVGYQEAIRATGDHLNVLSSRFEVNHIGLNLGVAPDGSIAPLTNSTFAGITEEANDTGFNLANVQNSYFESISGQGSSNAPTGMSITGIAIGDLSKNVTFAATEFGGDFTQQTLLVAPNADTIRFADTAFWNNSGQSIVIQAAHDQSFAVSSLFTANDLFDDAITQYDFWNSGTGGGHFLLNNQILGAKQDNYVSSAQLAQTTYVSGSGADMLEVRVSDGAQWGPWSPSVTVTARVDTGPVVAPIAANVSATHNQSFAVSSLFTASDPDGDTITQYGFWNFGTAGGHYVLNGVAQGTNQEIDVSAAQLSQLSYQSGSGADTLWVRANDGTQWSAWSSPFTVTAPVDTGPVTTPVSLTVILGHGQSTIAASSLFTTSESDGDLVAKYAFWDFGTGGGHFLVNGVAQGTQQEIDVAASQLAQVTYQAGSSTDMLWVRANDGFVWGPWTQAFTVSPFIDTPPTVSVSNLPATHGQSFAAASLFKASDPDGDTITQYGFWNFGTGRGHYVLNGVAQGTNQEIDVSAAQLSQLSYQSGSGVDTSWVRANDGRQWSAWSSPFTVTAPVDTGPVTTPVSLTVILGHGQSTIAASSLFTTSESDGDLVAKYAFWDFGTGGGHFLVNGVAQGTQQEIDVAASQLAQVTYQAGSSTDTLWVRANDGFVWGPWTQAFTVSPFIDTPPTVSVSNLRATHGQSFAAASLFKASDPDGDTITQYGFWNFGTGGGHYVLNGVAQGTNQEIDVSAAQLSQLSYQSGSGADTSWVRANDGTQWSAWSSPFTVTAPVDSGPVVTSVSNIKTTSGQAFAASSLFTASDPFGDAIAQYDFWDTGGGGGHFALNGRALGANQENIVAAAQLALTTYVSGSGTDTLWLRVNEGGQWSPWSPSFIASDPTTIGAGETLELASAFSGQLSFAAPTGILKLLNSESFAGTVAGMSDQDAIDFAGIDVTKVQQPTYSGTASDGTLTVTDGSHTANIALLGNYLASTFVTSSDGHGGTNVVDPSAAETSQASLLVQPPHA